MIYPEIRFILVIIQLRNLKSHPVFVLKELKIYKKLFNQSFVTKFLINGHGI